MDVRALVPWASGALLAAHIPLLAQAQTRNAAVLFLVPWVTFPLLIAWQRPRTPWPYWAGAVVLLGSQWGALAWASLTGAENWPAAYVTAWALSPMPLLLLIRRDMQWQPFVWALAVIEAGLVWWDGWTGATRGAGFMANPAVSSALILLGFVLMARRNPWIAALPLLGLPLAGSRWVSLVVAGFVLLFGRKRISFALAFAIAMMIPLTVMPGAVMDAYRLGDGIPEGMEQAADAAALRWSTEGRDWWQWVVPTGPISDSDADKGFHSVPLRIGAETGILAALAWLGMTAAALLRRPYGSPSWWGLLSMTAVSIMDYTFWQEALWIVWWALIAMRLKELRRNAADGHLTKHPEIVGSGEVPGMRLR